MNVHHTCYDRVGREQFGDMVVVCVDCHELVEDFIKRMVKKGFVRKRVLAKLKPYFMRKMWKVQEFRMGR